MTLSGMTGFARVEGQGFGFGWAVEARSVNGRGLDVKLRLPPGWDRLDPPIRAAAQARFARGSLQLSLDLRSAAEAQRVEVDHALLARLLAEGRRYVEEGLATTPRLDGLLALRGVLVSADAAVDTPALDALEQALIAGATAALDGLKQARLAEGAALQAALSALFDELAATAERARALASAQPAALRARIEQRLLDLAPDLRIDPQRLAQEAALVASKADVREELDRLAAHVAEGRAICAGGAAAGRRLEFLAQELNREANTLGAKSADLELTRAAMALKLSVDQIKEQAANVE